nr:immunoglobulin light chain junction region [Macaca mulatta]
DYFCSSYTADNTWVF